MGKRFAVLVAVGLVAAMGVGWWLVWGNNPSKPDQQRTKQTAAEAPDIELNVPQSSLLVQGDALTVSIRTDRYEDIARVEYYLDGTLAAYSTKEPFTVAIDLTHVNEGEHSLYAVAYTFTGKRSQSAPFTFTLTANKPSEPANQASKVIVQRSTPVSGSSSGSGGGNNSGGSDNGGANDTTPWPDTPPAQICGNNTILSGPSSAPAGAVVVPAGNNNGIDFEQDNTVYWFATGTHTIGSSSLSQIEPGDNATFVGAPGAIIDGQNINRHLFSQHAVNVKVQYLTIKNFATNQNEGNVNHDSGTGWTIEFNSIQNNDGAGVFAGSDNTIRYNCLKDNGQYGFQVFTNDPPGPSNVLIDHNEIVGNNQDDWEAAIPGCGCTGGGKFWDAENVTVTNNYVHDNFSVGLWADTNDNDFLIDGNYIADNQSQGIFYEISYNIIIRNNNLIGNGVVAGPGNPGFPTGALYLSEAGGDSRVPARTTQVEVYNNQFKDNWSGVILWENADRFCGSPNNTSTGTCTLVNPLVANLTSCKDPAAGGSIDDPPYYDDCRWKTQHVRVHNNTFSLDRSSIPQCTTNKACGFQGIFSNIGTDPSWSPYMGDVIQQAITFDQDNLFADNTYIGDWFFKLKSQSTVYNFAIWQNAPFGQDAGSTFNGQDHYVVTNALDEDTATLEGSIGKWTSWFSATPTRSSAEAHSGTHSLKVDITAAFGWGVQLNDPVGFPVTPLQKSISFWAKAGAGSGLGVTMELEWLDVDEHPIGSTQTVTLSPLTSSWQQATATITPPAGVTSVNLHFVHSSGTNGNSLYIDDIVIADPS